LDATLGGPNNPYYPNLIFAQDFHSDIKEPAVFGELSYQPIEPLKLTAGLRWYQVKATSAGYQEGLATGGGPVVVNPLASTEQSGVNPKFEADYHVTPDQMVYVNAAKGFRPGGFLPIVPAGEPGTGTTFKIYLPLISSEVRGEEIATEKETLAQGTETILLAEDDESVRKLISIVLKQEGYKVIEAIDGVDSVKKFIENKETIRLLLSDLIMPKMNGKEAYDEMKVWRPGLKAIFVSGYAPDVIRQKMSLENSVVLISKPILPYSLLKKVRCLLDEGEK
ncbi:MAG: TonB-dependent receptor, partial [Geobacteraceae bacterium]